MLPQSVCSGAGVGSLDPDLMRHMTKNAVGAQFCAHSCDSVCSYSVEFVQRRIHAELKPKTSK